MHGLRTSVLAMAVLLMSALLPTAHALTPQVNYQLQCMGCHGIDGTGENGRVPSVRRTLVPWSGLPDGRDFILRVPGVSQALLSDGELASVLNWMARHLSDAPIPKNFVDYSAAEVARARRRPLTDVASRRARLRATVPVEVQVPHQRSGSS